MSRILIADDEANICEVFSQALQSCGHEVTSVGDGHEALKLLEHESFDLIITDLQMPHCSGITLLASVRKTNPDARVILMSSHVNGSEEQFRAQGFIDVLPKPVSIARFLETVTRALGTFV